MNATQSRPDDAAGRGRQVTTLVSGKETEGRLALIEFREVAGCEPPRHVHDNEDETVYVQSGELTFFVGDQTIPAGPGACLFLPKGVEHGYAVESAEARLIVVCTPAGIERFYEELDAPERDFSVERLIAIAAGYGVAITGPAPESETD